MTEGNITLSVVANDVGILDAADDLKNGRRAAKARLIDNLANHLVEHFKLATTPLWNLYCYTGSIYRECENEVRSLIESYGRAYNISEYINKNVVNEVIDKVKRLTYIGTARIERSKWWLALRNGLLNIKAWVEDGQVELKEYDPAVFKTAYINAELREIPDGMDVDNWFEYGPKLCPNIHKAFIDWVGPENARVLYEIVGYTLWPDYPLHIAIMLVGEGSNGKSTFLTLLRTFLGRGNYVSIPLQTLTTNRFIIGDLYGKLANLFPDLPKAPLINTGIFKALTGQDEVYADVKHKKGFTFINYAKMIFSANELPEVKDQTYAFWRRWVVVEFPNRFEPNPDFINQLTTDDELAGLLIMALHALRDLLRRKQFTINGNFKEYWMRRANTVYAFVQDVIEACTNLTECWISATDLYNAYVAYCEDNDVEAYTQTKFTIELKRLLGGRIKAARKKVDGKLTRGYFGIRLKPPYGQEEEPEGLEEWMREDPLGW